MTPRPRRSLPPEEFCLGANPRNAANSRGPEKTPTSCTLAAIAEAVTGPIPGTLIRRRAFASVFTSSMMARSLTAISSLSACSSRIIGASASRTQSGMELSPSKIAAANAWAPFGPLGGYNADFRQMATQRVDKLRALRHQKFTHFVTHEYALVAD